MGITVPSSTPIVLAAQEVSGEYYQTFTLADNTGAQYSENNPLPVAVTVTGYSITSAAYQGSYLPTGGVYIADLTGTDFTEMLDGESGTIRLNNRRAIMTATDGQVTTLTESLSNNYHDTVVASGVTFDGITVPAYSSFFVYDSQQETRFVYIPLSKSGWKRASIYIKHSLVNDADAEATALQVGLYPDFGQFSIDFPALLDTISGTVGESIGRVYSCYTPAVPSSSITYVPELDSPLAGIIISLVNIEDVTGNVEIYASKSA
jgi:hypothetical protein